MKIKWNAEHAFFNTTFQNKEGGFTCGTNLFPGENEVSGNEYNELRKHESFLANFELVEDIPKLPITVTEEEPVTAEGLGDVPEGTVITEGEPEGKAKGKGKE